MSKYIIAERWSVTMGHDATHQNGPYLTTQGLFPCPNVGLPYNLFQADGMFRRPYLDPWGGKYFDPADEVLLRRARFWSPLMGLGLAGATIETTQVTQLNVRRRVDNSTGTVDIEFRNGWNLGEWVDINQTLFAGVTTDDWTIGLDILDPDLPMLDSSAVPTALVTSGTTYLQMYFQLELAHTIPAKL